LFFARISLALGGLPILFGLAGRELETFVFRQDLAGPGRPSDLLSLAGRELETFVFRAGSRIDKGLQGLLYIGDGSNSVLFNDFLK